MTARGSDFEVALRRAWSARSPSSAIRGCAHEPALPATADWPNRRWDGDITTRLHRRPRRSCSTSRRAATGRPGCCHLPGRRAGERQPFGGRGPTWPGDCPPRACRTCPTSTRRQAPSRSWTSWAPTASPAGCWSRPSAWLLTDTTMRDAHQSLLATRLRTYDMLGRAALRPADAGAVLAGVLGRGDLRRRHALFEGGPLGPAGTAAPAGAQRAVPDAAARGERARLQELPGQRGEVLRRAGGGRRRRRLPGLRLAQLGREHAHSRWTRCANRASCARRRSATPAT